MSEPASEPGPLPTAVPAPTPAAGTVALTYSRRPDGRKPPEALAFTAAVCSLCGLVFLPLGPVGLLLGLAALATFRRRMPAGRTMTVIAIVAGLVSTAGLVAVVYYVLHMPVAEGGGGMTAGAKG